MSEEHPHMRLTRPDCAPPTYVDEYLQYLRHCRDNFRPIGEVPKTPEETKFLEDIFVAAVALGDRLGVDVRDRMPKITDFHIFTDQKAYEEAVRIYWPDATDKFLRSGGIKQAEAGVLWMRRPTPEANESGFAHELWHEIVAKTMRPLEPHKEPAQGEQKKLVSCVGINHISAGVDEILADFGEVELMHSIGRHRIIAGYLGTDIITDELIKKVASDAKDAGDAGIDPVALHDALLRVPLTHDMSGLRTLGRFLSNKQMRHFLALGQRSTYEDNIRSAELLGLPEAVEKLKTLAIIEAGGKGQVPDLLEWVPINVFTDEELASRREAVLTSASHNPGSVIGVYHDLMHVILVADESKAAANVAGNSLVGLMLTIEGLANGSSRLEEIGASVGAVISTIRNASSLLLDTQAEIGNYLDSIGALGQ
ncbi:MAG TPA: hypothetical protein VMR45_06185 [Patescibacteria group bacterium]|nr:hypothetical protein [Patescibacteria group bacterium]